MENQFNPGVGLFLVALVLSCKNMFRKRSKTRMEKVLISKQKNRGKLLFRTQTIWGCTLRYKSLLEKQ